MQTEDEAEHGVIEEDQVLMVVSRNEFEDMVVSHKTVTSHSTDEYHPPFSCRNNMRGQL